MPEEPRPSPYDRLKQAILHGEFVPGQALVEARVAAWLGVSRTPTREALRRLEQDGLLSRDAEGLKVRTRGPEEILDIYDTRIVLEGQAATVAAERRTDHDIRMLRWSLASCQEVDEQDSAGKIEANEMFHRALWQATHNESLIDLLERLSLHLGRYPETTLVAPGRWSNAIIEHTQLVEAIERRDSVRAAEVARNHFIAARDIRLDLFARENSRLRRDASMQELRR